MRIDWRVRLELEAWTADVIRSRREYRLHPHGVCRHGGRCKR